MSTCGIAWSITLFKPLRQPIESVNGALKEQLDLEQHSGRTPAASPFGSCSASWR